MHVNVGEQMIWFTGVVEDVNDPLKVGRVRVRCHGWHTDDRRTLPTSDLPFAQIIQSPTSAAVGDIGHSPTGIVNGSWVVGFFLDGKQCQYPVVLGTLSGIPQHYSNTVIGFSDPQGVYPKRIHEPDVNRLARNDAKYVHPMIDKKEQRRVKGVQLALGGGTWDEPAVDRSKTTYPNNTVVETRCGHIVEYDDSVNGERIHQYHKAGTYTEIDSDGRRVTHVVNLSLIHI